MNSERNEYPKRVSRNNTPAHVEYSFSTVLLAVVGYVAVLLLALLVNNYRGLLFSSDDVDSSRNNVGDEHSDKGAKDLNWEFIGTSGAAQVDSYVRKVEGSKLFAFKGVVVIDEHISDVLQTFGSVSTTPEWADMLQVMETLPVFEASTEQPLEGPINAPTPKKNIFGSMLNKLIRPKKNIIADTRTMGDGDNILLHRPYTPATTKTNIFGATTNIPATNLSDIVYQYYILPWPIAPREFLFHRDFRLYPATSTVTADYSSIHDARHPLPSPNRPHHTPLGAPISKHTIRAESPFAHWVFQDLDAHCAQYKNSRQGMKYHTQEAQICDELALQRAESAYLSDQASNYAYVEEQKRTKKTFVSIETLVDNKGSLPPWVVNYVQRSWPSKTLSAFAASVRRQATGYARNSDNDFKDKNLGTSNVIDYLATW
eukprot:gene10029-11754_t